VLEAEAAAGAEAKKAQEKAQERAQEWAEEKALEARLREARLPQTKEELDRGRVRIEAMYPDLERDWTFKTGRKRKAKFVRLDGNAVLLDFSEAPSGLFVVPIENLSQFDQAVARAAAAAGR
jgi:hypothetical protein